MNWLVWLTRKTLNLVDITLFTYRFVRTHIHCSYRCLLCCWMGCGVESRIYFVKLDVISGASMFCSCTRAPLSLNFSFGRRRKVKVSLCSRSCRLQCLKLVMVKMEEFGHDWWADIQFFFGPFLINRVISSASLWSSSSVPPTACYWQLDVFCRLTFTAQDKPWHYNKTW